MATLSGGEQQRAAIAWAPANRPAIVLADEPTGQVGLGTADRILALLTELQRTTETALVVVSHDRALGDRFSKRVELVNGTLSVRSPE
jgi:predicted ABC-type transport system involved in lysophospholipase L1 biosynthesis ATPase subunit